MGITIVPERVAAVTVLITWGIIFTHTNMQAHTHISDIFNSMIGKLRIGLISEKHSIIFYNLMHCQG